MELVNIRGLNFANVTMDEAITEAESLINSNCTNLVFTPNAEIAYKASHDKDFENLLNSASLLLPDGAGCLKAAKIIGTPIKEKVAGVVFGERLAELASKNGYSLFLLGGKPGIAEKAANELAFKYSGLNIVGTNDGYFNKENDESCSVIDKINASNADIVYVCLGAPTQEIWASKNKNNFKNAKIVACLGGSLDIYSKTSKRAPSFFIKTNTEWLYRLIKEPWRLKRMMSLPKYIVETRKFAKSK
ncbi:MAG: WecB/TagA/CpsF family glycosyltransferase [Clostridia bacterium]|nr:WecB/TagA/CpsF family glycosyltransferase [Clostridia bacterium]